MDLTHFEAVRAFHHAIGNPGPAEPTLPPAEVVALRQTLLHEEFNELLNAVAANDLTAIAGEAIDVLYVTYGLCVAYGIDADAVFAVVQQANMAKVAGPRRADGKILKPANWTPPDIAGVLARQVAKPVSVILVFDGGSHGNPGPGYGSYHLQIDQHIEPATRLSFEHVMTNTQAEYRTLITALQALHSHQQIHAHQIDLQIYGDSRLVINQLTQQLQAQESHMAALHDEAQQLLKQFGSWQAHWQPRQHSVERLGH